MTNHLYINNMKNILPILLLAMLSSCVSNSKYDNVVSQLNDLKEENQKLKTQIESQEKELVIFKTDPEKLLKDADNYFSSNNESELLRIQKLFADFHPQSKHKLTVDGYCTKLKLQKEKERLAIEQEKKQEEERRLSAVKRMKKNYDDVSGQTWYENPYFTHYTNSNLTSIYIGQSNSNVWLRLKMSYYGDSWIFFENAYLSYDGKTLNIPFDQYQDKKTENDSSTWEWIDVRVSDDMLTFIRQMVNGKDIKMRLSGKYTKTRNLSTNEIKAIKDILLAYDVLVSNQNNQ